MKGDKMSDAFRPQFTPRGDLAPPNYGHNGLGDPIMIPTNARGDVVIPNYGRTLQGDPIPFLVDARGDGVVTPTIPNTGVPDAVQARLAHEESLRYFLRGSGSVEFRPTVSTTDAKAAARARDEIAERLAQIEAGKTQLRTRLVGGLAALIASKAEGDATDSVGSRHSETIKPAWTGYEDFRQFKRHGMVDLLSFTDQDMREYVAEDVVRSQQEAADWRSSHIDPEELFDMGYLYLDGEDARYRSETDAAKWRVENSADDESRRAEEHFLSVLQHFRAGPHQGNIWQASRASTVP